MVLSCGEASSQTGWRPDGMHVELGRSTSDSAMAGLGLRWDWRWQRQQWGGRLTGGTELSLAYWSARSSAGRNAQPHLNLTPLLRWQGAGGSSPWFIEGGIGLSFHPHPSEIEEVPMSTSWNFHDVLAVGYRLGQGSDLSLRAVHISNAGIRSPNPGAEVLMLRWAQRF